MSANNWSEKKNQGVPLQLKCAGDGKWESKDMFSNNMLQKYKSGQRNITCRKHTSRPISEMKCANCTKTKPLNCFSNSERKLNGLHRCRDCVDWFESDIPGYCPLPPPNSERTIEEREFYNKPRQIIDFFDEYEQEEEDYTTETDGATFTNDLASSVGESKSSSAGPASRLTTYALQSFNTLNPAYKRCAQSHQTPSAPTDTASTVATASTVRPRNHVYFNAYGPEGQFQERVQSVTAASEKTTTNASSGAPGRKNWVKVPGRKTAIAAPAYLQYENPDEVGDCHDSDGSVDYC